MRTDDDGPLLFALHRLVLLFGAEEIHGEMTSLKVAEEWMVDELDFRMDSYQTGGDVAAELLDSLVDDVVDDLQTGSFLQQVLVSPLAVLVDSHTSSQCLLNVSRAGKHPIP